MVSDERRDYYAAALMGAIGAGVAYMGFQLQIGTLTRMGPGFFPAILGILMVIMGAMIALTRSSEGPPPAARPDAMHPQPSHVDVRGWGCIISAMIGFVVLCQYAGLLPATFFCVFVAATGDRESDWRKSALLALGVTIFAYVLFDYVLRVQIPAIVGFLS